MKRGNNLVIFSVIILIFGIFFLTKKKTIILEPLYQIPYFSYLTQDNSMFTTNNLKEKISVVDFFFTGCNGPCPAMNAYMKHLLVSFLDEDNLQFISFSVDPLNDSNSVIKEYVYSGYLNYKNWYFLQTDTLSISPLLEDGFKLFGDGLPGMHSTKFILTDINGYIIGYYNPFVDKEFSLLKDHISYLLDTI